MFCFFIDVVVSVEILDETLSLQKVINFGVVCFSLQKVINYGVFCFSLQKVINYDVACFSLPI